jgi:uncharacterized phage protein (TIGR01671 family)
MKKEIKFRAWQPHMSLSRKAGMYEVESIHFYEGVEDSEVFFGAGATTSEYISDIVLMQFTGLKDKAGGPIHEGDVIRAKSWFYGRKFQNPSGTTLLVMEWQTDGFKAKRIGRLQSFQFSLLDLPEVVGNIYENPELLGGDDEPRTTATI